MATKQTKKAGAAATVHEPEVMPAESPDLGLVRDDGTAIGSFLGNMVTFFRVALVREEEAKKVLADAKAFKPPTTLDEDAAVQVFIRTRVNAPKKALADFWSVRLLFHNVHRKMNDGYKRADQHYIDAGAIAQELHNRYAADARRAAVQEQERIRQEHERLAREQQERDAAALDANALKLEEASTELSERESQFVDYMTNPLNAVERGDAYRSAARAGFKEPLKAGARLLGLVKIQNAIKARQDALAIREQAQAVRQAPVQVETPVVQAEVSRVGGHDRTTYGAELLDAQAFINAVFEGKHGIPRDVLMVDEAALGRYGRDMKELIDRWPGVRHTKKTKTI